MPRQANPTFITEQEVFPRRLRALMDRGPKTSQAVLAEALDVRRQTVSLYATGQSKPDYEQLRKIAEYFSVSTDYLVGLSDVKSTDTELKAVCEYMGLYEDSVHAIRAITASNALPHHYAVTEAAEGDSLLPRQVFENMINLPLFNRVLGNITRYVLSEKRTKEQEATDEDWYHNVHEQMNELSNKYKELEAHGCEIVPVWRYAGLMKESAVGDFRCLIEKLADSYCYFCEPQT